MLSVQQLDAVADLLLEVAEAEILPRFRALAPGDVRAKSSRIDLVTVADEAAERMLMARLGALFPGAALIGEESAARDPSTLRALAQSEWAIVIDPIDGTKNFASGLALFGVMVAVLRAGQVVASVICDPLCGDWVMALRGHGAWTRHRDGRREPLRVARADAVHAMDGCGLWAGLAEPLRSRVALGLTRFASNAAYRCAASDFRLVANGHYHFAMFHKLTPWDQAPGVLLHQEAGGYSAHFDGADYDPLRTDSGLLLAPDQASWLAIRDTLGLAPPIPVLPASAPATIP